ncbi:cytochrome c [Serratia ureilytica]
MRSNDEVCGNRAVGRRPVQPAGVGGGDAAAGQAKAAACAACHGAQGKVTVPMYPNLAGQNAMYLQHALQAYKKGERNGGQAEVMKAYVSGLSDDDIADLAAYYASLKP